MRDKKIEVRLNGAELAKIDEHRGGLSRPAYLRGLLQAPSLPDDEPTHRESLSLLYRLARDGKVQATIALERALRETADDVRDDFFPSWLAD